MPSSRRRVRARQQWREPGVDGDATSHGPASAARLSTTISERWRSPRAGAAAAGPEQRAASARGAARRPALTSLGLLRGDPAPRLLPPTATLTPVPPVLRLSISAAYSGLEASRLPVTAGGRDHSAGQQRHRVGQRHRGRRCATTRAVAPARISCSALVTRSSVCTSSADSGSSRISTSGWPRWPGPARSAAAGRRKAPALFADPGVQAQGRSNANRGLRGRQRGFDRGSSASGAAEHDVLPDAGGEQRRVLEGATRPRAEPVSGRSRTSVPSSRTEPEACVGQSRYELKQCRLAGPVAPVSTTVLPGGRSSTMSRSTGSAAPG